MSADGVTNAVDLCWCGQAVIRDLEVKALSIEGSIASKQHALATLEKHCDDAKR